MDSSAAAGTAITLFMISRKIKERERSFTALIFMISLEQDPLEPDSTVDYQKYDHDDDGGEYRTIPAFTHDGIRPV